MKPKIHFNRRQALCMICSSGAGLVSLNPLKSFLDSMVDGIFMKAQAAAGALPSRNYFMVTIPGGPPRWHFDQLLNPYTPDSALVKSESVLTAFGPGANAQTAGAAIYKTYPVTVGNQTLNLPPVWSANIPTAQGGSVPMKSILPYFLSIRGISNPTSSHFLGSYDKLRPAGASPSIDGLVADGSNSPVSAVGLTYNTSAGEGDATFTAFKSGTGMGHTLVQTTDFWTGQPIMSCVQTLLAPFDRTSDAVTSAYLNRRSAMQGMINGALTQLAAQASIRQPGTEALYNVRNSAEALLKEGVTAFSEQYPALLAKYQGIITACANYSKYPIPGVTDRVVPASTQNQTYLNGWPTQKADLRTMITPNAYVGGLADAFANAELLIINGLSSSIIATLNGVGNVDFGNDGAPNLGAAFSDEHGTGIVGSIFTNTYLFMCYGACIYELSQSLGAKGLWEQTVTHLSAEFPRSPSFSGTVGIGTDHAGTSNLYTMFSGAIKSPLVLGNVQNDASGGSGDPTNPTYGNWGVSAPTVVGGANVNLLLGHATSTLCALLRIPPIMSNNQSLVGVNANGDVTGATVDLARNV
jgi:hypothetical protein